MSRHIPTKSLTRKPPIMRHIILTLLAGTTLTLAACSTDSSTSSNGTATPSPVSTVAVKAATNPLGNILVSPAGLTLYAFTKDVDAKSSCTGSCAATWPPVIVNGDLAVDSGLTSALFKVVDRPDGRSNSRPASGRSTRSPATPPQATRTARAPVASGSW